MSEWVSVCEWVSESESESVSVSVSEWVSVCVRSEWVCVCVWGGGRAGEAADTELKTKTPHVNVGKKQTH